tara:strand:- start:348 stop:527 length:180 start_codon:yes stop_codon:yes gene_type:complete
MSASESGCEFLEEALWTIEQAKICDSCVGSGLEGYDPEGDGLYKCAKPCPVCMGEGTDG